MDNNLEHLQQQINYLTKELKDYKNRVASGDMALLTMLNWNKEQQDKYFKIRESQYHELSKSSHVDKN